MQRLFLFHCNKGYANEHQFAFVCQLPIFYNLPSSIKWSTDINIHLSSLTGGLVQADHVARAMVQCAKILWVRRCTFGNSWHQAESPSSVADIKELSWRPRASHPTQTGVCGRPQLWKRQELQHGVRWVYSKRSLQLASCEDLVSAQWQVRTISV
jgi:hypothetical protein